MPFKTDEMTQPLFAACKTPLALMLDYDGTLTPIVNDPSTAYISNTHLEVLLKLSQLDNIKLAIVSGRSVEQLLYFLNPLVSQNILFCGLHGGQIYCTKTQQHLKSIQSESTHEILKGFESALIQLLFENNLLNTGLIIENKEYAVAMHYRMAERSVQEKAMVLFEQLYAADAELTTLFRLQLGKQVLEILPTVFNKGDGVRFILDYWQDTVKLLPCYVGDDLTDEAAFIVVNEKNGISVCIAKAANETTARYVIPTIDRLYVELQKLY